MIAYLASLGFVVLAEMGDKTQLATVALATQYKSIVAVWLGTTSGMLVADAIGIIVGIVLGKKIPEKVVKWFAALVFIAFGIIGLYDALPRPAILPVMTGVAVMVSGFLYYLKRTKSEKSSLKPSPPMPL